jgi:hypothetical protein
MSLIVRTVTEDEARYLAARPAIEPRNGGQMWIERLNVAAPNGQAEDVLRITFYDDQTGILVYRDLPTGDSDRFEKMFKSKPQAWPKKQSIIDEVKASNGLAPDKIAAAIDRAIMGR